MNTNNNINNALTSLLNAATITASAKLSASAGIYSKPLTNKSTITGSNLNAKNSDHTQLTSSLSSVSCLNSHTFFQSDDDEQHKFINDKLLHQIGTNLVDLSVCWHKMSDTMLNESLLEKMNPIDEEGTMRVDEMTKKTFHEEFASLIIKETYDRTGFDMTQILEANKNQPIGKFAEQIQFLTIQSTNVSSNVSINTLVDQIKVFNKYNQNQFHELKYQINPEEDTVDLSGFIKIHWNLKNPIKLTDPSLESMNENLLDDLHSSFKATSIRDLNKKKKGQISLDDTFSRADTKMSDSFFRNQTVKVKSNSKSSSRGSILSSDFLKEEKQVKDEMFIPSYGSASSIRVDNSTTCYKAIKILLEKFRIRNSPEDYSLYKVYQSGEIRELKSDDIPLIQRLYMGPFNEDKIFIMEKGRNVTMDPDVMNLISLPEALLNALLESSKREETKEISEFKQKYVVYRELLQHRLKSLE